MVTTLVTQTGPFAKAKATDDTSGSFAAKVPTKTEPTGDGVIDLANLGAVVPNGVKVVPFCVGVNNDTFSVRVIGWHKVGAGDTGLWVPVTLVELACTAGTSAGVAGTVVDATHLFADTLTLTTGNDDISVDVVSPTDNTIAHAVADVKGFQKIEFSFKTGTTPTACNALYSFI